MDHAKSIPTCCIINITQLIVSFPRIKKEKRKITNILYIIAAFRTTTHPSQRNQHQSYCRRSISAVVTYTEAQVEFALRPVRAYFSGGGGGGGGWQFASGLEFIGSVIDWSLYVVHERDLYVYRIYRPGEVLN